MATFRHVETGKRFLFIHIPRTGGRFLETNLEESGWVWDDDVGVDKKYKSVEGIEVAHFHREYYEKYLDVKDIPHIAIVRNPIDKFISSSIYLKRLYGNDIQELMEDPMYFGSMIDNFPCPESVNWYRPQIDFLSDKTHIWKFEDGLGDEFASWISSILDIDIDLDQDIKYNKDPDEHNKLDKTPLLIDNVMRFYSQDIEQLYPELATSLQEGEKTKT